MSMAEPLLPDPSERDAPGPLGHGEAVDDAAGSEIRDEIDRSDEASASRSDDHIATADTAQSDPVHLSQSRLTPEELTQDLAEEGTDS